MTFSPSPLSQAYSTLPRSSGYLAYHRYDSKNTDLPEVLFLGGYKADMNGTKATFLDSLCRERQQTYTRFDYSGHGSSTGDFDEGTISGWLSDCLAIIDEVTKGPLILIGSSLGGWLMTLAALARPERVKALIGIASAPDFTEDLIWNLLNENQRQDFIKKGVFYLPSESDPRGLPISLEFIEDGRKNLVLREDINITCPVHLIHGTADTDVSPAFSERLAERLKSPEVSLTLIKDGDHRLSSPFALNYLSMLIQMMSY